MYTLRFPFRVPEGREVEVPVACKWENSLACFLARLDEFYILTIEGFESAEAAENYIPRLWAGLAWMLLERGLVTTANFDVGTTQYADDPEEFGKRLGFSTPADGIADGYQPTIYRTDRQLRFETLGMISPLQRYGGEGIVASVLEGAMYPSSANVWENKKLRLAFDLYNAHFTESSENSRFLTLVMALEAMSEPKKRTPKVVEFQKELLRQAKAVNGEIDAVEADTEEEKKKKSDDKASIEALINDLNSRCSDSLTRQVKRLVRETLASTDGRDVEGVEKDVAQIYGTRGRLVHNGEVSLNALRRSTELARKIVRLVLKARFIGEASG